MAAHLQHPTFNVVYDYATYLVECIHKGLVHLKGGKDWVNFWWYSLLIHMFLYKEEIFFGKDVKLNKKEDGIDLPVQCWTQILEKDDQKFDYVVFQNAFASKLSRFLIHDPARIPKEIHDFLRPMERRTYLNLNHN